MNYKDIFTAAFSEVAPRKSEDAAAREIIEKGKAMKTTKTSTRKIFTSIAAAAAVLMIGGVTVGAATGWSFTDAFDKLFAERSEDASYVSPIDFTKMGKELDVKFETEDYTIDVRGVAASKKSLFLLYDITFSDEFIAENPIDENDLVDSICFFTTGDNGSSITDMYMHEGNTYSFYNLHHNYNKESTSGNIKVDFRSIIFGETTIDCDHEFDLKLDFNILEDIEIVYPYIMVQAGEDNVLLNKIVYDAFSIQLNFDYEYLPDALGKLCDDFADSYITKTDGTQMSLVNPGGQCSNNSDGMLHADFKVPVLPEEIESITFGDYTIPLK